MLEVQKVLAILARHREELQTAGVKSLAAFGSLSRGEANPKATSISWSNSPFLWVYWPLSACAGV